MDDHLDESLCEICEILMHRREGPLQTDKIILKILNDQYFLSIKVRRKIFWSEWIDVVWRSRWLVWTTPEMRTLIVKELKDIYFNEQLERQKERDLWNMQLEKYARKYEAEEKRKREAAIRQWL